MAADYIVDLDCPVKRELSSEGLVRLLKQEGYAYFYLQTYMQQEGLSQEEALDKPMQVVVQRPEGDTTKETTVRAAIQEAAVLKGLSQHCQNCPVSQGDNFGCSQSINYPMSRRFEEWLGTLIEKNLADGGLESSAMLKFIVDQNIKGDHYKNLRVNFAGRIVESDQPVSVVYKKGFLSKKSINTNQILELLLGFPELPASLCALGADFGGTRKAVHVFDKERAEQIDEQFVQDTMSGKIKPTKVEYTPYEGDQSDRTISQFTRFFKALHLANEQNVQVILDA